MEKQYSTMVSSGQTMDKYGGFLKWAILGFNAIDDRILDDLGYSTF